MPDSLVAVKILLLLMPGYLTLSIRESLAGKRVRTEIERVYTILLYDIIIFGLYLLIKALKPSLTPFYISMNNEQLWMVGITLFNIGIVFVASTVLAIFLAELDIHGWGYILFRKLKLTYKTGRSSVWNDVFYEQQGFYVIMHLEDKTRIFGWIGDYPTDQNVKDFFVRDARYLGTTPDKDVKINGPGILITNEAKVKYIEFLYSA